LGACNNFVCNLAVFCFSRVKLLLDNVNKIWNEVGPSEGTFISS